MGPLSVVSGSLNLRKIEGLLDRLERVGMLRGQFGPSFLKPVRFFWGSDASVGADLDVKSQNLKLIGEPYTDSVGFLIYVPLRYYLSTIYFFSLIASI